MTTETHYQLKNLYRLIHFKPDNNQVFKDIHIWKYQVIKGKIDKIQAVLKISHNFHPEGYFELLNEIAADNLIKRFEHKSRKRAPHFRRVLLTGSDSSLTWLAKEFIGEPFGVSHYVINSRFRKNQRQLINKAFNELDRLHSIPYPEFQHFIPQRFPAAELSTMERRLKRLYRQNEYKDSLNYYFDNQHVLQEKKVFVHGDFDIANMIVSKNIVFLTDFEFSGSDHPMTDLARLWMMNSLNLNIRKEIIKRYIKSSQEDKAFCMALARDLLYLLIFYGKNCHQLKDKNENFKKTTVIEQFSVINSGIEGLLKLAEVQAKKYAPLERELIDKPYR